MAFWTDCHGKGRTLPHVLRTCRASLRGYSANLPRLETPSESKFLIPWCRAILATNPSELPDDDLRKQCEQFQSWDKGAEFEALIHDIEEIPERKKGRRRPDLFNYFQGAIAITVEQCNALRSQLEGVMISYRMLMDGSVLKSLFLIPGSKMLWFNELIADPYLPVFLHWLSDKEGYGRYVLGHIVPLHTDVAMIGFVADPFDPKVFSGVKVITFEPQRRPRYTRIRGAFLSRYIEDEYEAAKCILVRPSPELAQKIEKAARDFLSDSAASTHERIEAHLKPFLGSVPVDQALKELKMTEEDFRNELMLTARVEQGGQNLANFIGPVLMRR
jgi:hypothetical protein